jgi:RES domain-containing protein
LTPEDLSLDPEIFLLNQPLMLYRLARNRYANLSGVGAAQYPGRWNRHRQEAIYTSTEIAVPVLERLVHTPKDLIPSNLALMKIKVSTPWDAHAGSIKVSTPWDAHAGSVTYGLQGRVHLRICRTLAIAKQSPDLLGDAFWFALAVPSVVVPAWNVVLYPQALGFWEHVSLESVEPFELDPRLFPEGTPIEMPE